MAKTRNYQSKTYLIDDTEIATLDQLAQTNTEVGTKASQVSVNDKVDKTTTVNGHPLSSNVTVTKTDVGLSNVPNLDTSTTANITDFTNKRFVTDTQQTVIGNTSGINTGNQDLSGLATKATTVNGHALSANVVVTQGDVGLGNCNNTSDANKPISTATQTALNTKEPTVSSGTASQYWRGDKTWQALATVGATGSYTDLLNKPTIPSPITYYKSSGAQTTPIKVWIDTVTPSTANGHSIDISSAGFSTILGYNIIAVRNTATPTSVPNVAVKTISANTLVVNIVSGSALTQTILAATVLLGLPIIFADVTGVTLSVMVWGM